MSTKVLKKNLLDIFGTIIGAFIIAFAVSFFLLPNQLSSGGFSGIATILYYLLKIPMGTTILILNIPLFLWATFKIGKFFLLKSLLGTICLSIFIDFFNGFPEFTSDKILACVYGGILTGLGTAIILKSHSSTGGSDLATIIFKKYNPMYQSGQIITILDSIIIFLNVIFLKEIEIGLYSAITIYLMGKVIDILFEGLYFTKLLFIISDKNVEISHTIKTSLKRGVTGLYGKGMYSQEDKLVLMCVIGRNDLSELKSAIKKIDPKAFIIITNSREVLGYGFSS